MTPAPAPPAPAAPPPAAEAPPPAARGAAPRPARRGRGGGGAHAARRRAREFALQALYAFLIGRDDPARIDAHVRDQEGFEAIDRLHYEALLFGCVREEAELDALLARHVDRRVALLSPVEHAVLWIGAWELKHVPDMPYRVCINEAVELAKAFGATDGHKYVNGVLDKTAGLLRPEEVAAWRAQVG
jgi:N utilization substance protein B